MSPQNTPEWKNYSNPHRKKISRAKLDTLRAEGRCFNCKEVGHEQRNCPRLNSMKPPATTIRTGSVNLVRMDRLAEQKEKADIYVGQISMSEVDLITKELQRFKEIEYRVHSLCEEAWGEDPLWHNEETRHECRWSVGADEQEITVWDFEKSIKRTFPMSSIKEPGFNIAEIFVNPEPNRTPTSIHEGGYPIIEEYKRWEWPAIYWIQAQLAGQLEFVDEANKPLNVQNEDRINMQPTMFGYSIQLDESDVIYNITHKEVIDKHFSPEHIIDQMLAVRNVLVENRDNRFRDQRFTSYTMLMLGMTTIPGQKMPIRKRGTKKHIVQPEGISAIERTALQIKDKTQKLPEPIVILIKVNRQQIQALLDTGLMADFLLATMVDQLQLPKETYEKPLLVQLAVHSSRSKINCSTTVRMQYQTIDCNWRFDITNLDNYDAILGTPFLYQHQVTISFNPSHMIVGLSEPLEMKGPKVMTITSVAADLLNKGLDEIRQELRQEAEDLCPDTSRTALPLMRVVNHTIPLIDEKKIYRFRPSKCPEAFRDQW